MVKKMKNRKDKNEDVFVVEEDKPFVNFEDKEWYRAKFIEHEVSNGRYGKVVSLKFKVLSGEMEDGSSAKGKEITGFTGADLSPSRKFYGFCCALAGKELEVDEVVDLKAYYGKIVNVFVEQKSQKGSDKVYSNVTAIKERKKKVRK